MAIAVYFSPESMTKAQYQASMKKLEEKGGWPPPECRLHSCFGEDGHLMVFDVWDSQAAFEKFGETLMPILAEVGFDPGQPQIMPLENIVQQ